MPRTLVALFFAALLVATASATNRTVRIGVIDNRKNATASYLFWEPTFGTFLSSELARIGSSVRSELIALPFQNLTDAFTRKDIDLVFTNTGHAAILQSQNAAVPVASIENLRLGNPLSVFGGTAFTWNGSGVRDLSDCLKPEHVDRVVAVNRLSFAGYALPVCELHEQGRDVSTLMQRVQFVGSHENSLEQCALKQKSCCFIRTDKFESNAISRPHLTTGLVQLSPKTGLKYSFFPFKASTQLYPEWQISAQPEFDRQLIEIIQAILFSIRPADDVAIKSTYSRWFTPSDLTTVKQCLKTVGLISTPSASSSSSLSAGSIAGISVGGFIAIVLFAAAALMLRAANANAGRNTKFAPKDPNMAVAIIFTDIQSSTALWAMAPEDMSAGVDAHHTIIRRRIAQHKAYEVKTVGDCFMIASSDPQAAADLATGIQEDLNRHDWGTMAFDEIYARLGDVSDFSNDVISCTSSVTSATVSGKRLWSGLRVRIGMAYGKCDIKYDEIAKGYDYYGSTVNMASRIESCAHGGQTIINGSLNDALTATKQLHMVSLGAVELRGLESDGAVNVHQVLPRKLRQRVFPPLRVTNVDEQLESIGMPISEVLSDVHSHVSAASKQESAASGAIPTYQTFSHALLVQMVSPMPKDQQRQTLAAIAKCFRIQSSASSSVSDIALKLSQRVASVVEFELDHGACVVTDLEDLGGDSGNPLSDGTKRRASDVPQKYLQKCASAADPEGEIESE